MFEKSLSFSNAFFNILMVYKIPFSFISIVNLSRDITTDIQHLKTKKSFLNLEELDNLLEKYKQSKLRKAA